MAHTVQTVVPMLVMLKNKVNVNLIDNTRIIIVVLYPVAISDIVDIKLYVHV